jgi:hypothetical protein
MADTTNIFAKLRLTPGQWRAVAERRFGDARYLVESGNAERATGGIYMAGFVIECLLKALTAADRLERGGQDAPERGSP